VSRYRLLLVALLCLKAAIAHAAPDLIAVGSISGTYEDFATETAGLLENGIPGNRLGGMGSGLAYAGGNTFLALPDRGPNAKAYNSAVDDTTSYIVRFHTLSLSLAPSDAGSPLPFTLTPMLVNTTLLSSKTPLVYGTGAGVGLGSGAPALNAMDHTYYFTGRSDNFDPSKSSTNPANARLDPEGIRVANHSRSVFISDEYGPYVYEFDRESGRRVRAVTLPAKFAVSRLSAVGAEEISGNTSGWVANKGMEGLAIPPDGKQLVGIMQNALIQDGGPTVRIVTIDVVAVLGAHGITSDKVPAKIEGLAFGQDVVIGGQVKHTLYVANDNDYNAVFGGLDNPNAWFVFAFDDTDLPGFVPQQLRHREDERVDLYRSRDETSPCYSLACRWVDRKSGGRT